MPFLGDELQNRGACPASAPTQGGSSPQSLPCKGRWMRRKAQTEGCIAGWRQKYPARPGRPLPCLRRGRCSHRPGNPAVAQGPRGGRNRPSYIAARSGRQYESGSPLPGPPAGRCKHRPLRRGAASAGCAAGCRSRSRRPYALHCRAGVHARRGGALRQPRRILARQGAAPLSRLTPTAPLTGEPFGWKPFTKPPLQGEVDAPQGADGGVHCRFAAKISCKARQALALPP